MRNIRFTLFLNLILITVLAMASANTAYAAPPVIQPTLVNTILTSQFSPSSPDPTGLTYNPNTGTLILCDSEVEEMSNLYTGKNVFVSTFSGQLLDSFTTVPTPIRSYEPAGLAYNPLNGHLFISDDNSLKVFEDDPGADGLFNTLDDVVRSFSSSAFGNSDPEGIAYDSWHNHIFLTSGAGEEIYEIHPGPNGVFEGSGDDVITHFDTTVLGLRDPESVEFNSDTGNLFILSALSNKIGEVTPSGEVLRYIDISLLNGLFEAGLTYAPGSNNPLEKHLYIVARGIDNNNDPNENDGKLYEIAFPPLTSTSTPPVTAPDSQTPTVTSTHTSTATPTVTLTPTATFTSTPTIDPFMDVLFADGFESGDLSAWTSSLTNGGNLAVSPGSAMVGNYGLDATISSNTNMYVEYNHPGIESHYRARFYFDLNSIAMARSNSHLIFFGYSNPTTPVLRIELRKSAKLYQLRPAVWNDTGTWIPSSYLAITDAPHFIEFDYQASTAPGANNGFLTFWIDGVQQASLTALDNDTRPIDFVRLGPLSGIDTGTRGTYYFDAFEARRISYIGAAIP